MFTEQQLKDWEAYERVRLSGKFNMFDPKARKLTRLSEKEYYFVLTHFPELKAAVAAAREKASE